MNELELFAAAIAIADVGERASLLDRGCAGRPDVRQRIDQLLAAHFRSHPLLDQPIPERTGAYVPNEQLGAVIAGRYKLLEAIGEGGMGTVWVAEQTQPVRRKVALKLIKAGMDSKSVIARFEAERQALALMDHPNVAKVLDGGLTETGRPYFVMEYVKGVPITEYCDAARLSVAERLQLFTQVCQAVQHAHQKGIIHRDLKPSNILVAPYDDKPVPKIIDFGLAKAMHQSLTERTLHTAHETVLGTPLYMSPEQAQLNNLDVDTRSDIYSLGVLLYELLTGTTPLEKKRFKEAAWDEVRRLIREEEPPRPSTRLNSTATLPSLAACRQTEPLKLTKQVRGDLDWIVMKALEKDRSRRYETATGFAADVQRYLGGEAVQAHPPSAAYRVKKFVRRNKGQVFAASLVLLALLAGIAGTTWGLIRAETALAAEAEQRRLAEENEGKALAAAAAEKAAKERESAQWAKEEKTYARTVDVLDAMTSGVTDDVFFGPGEITAEQEKMLTEVLSYYKEFAGEQADDEKTRARTANAASHVAELEFKLKRQNEGIAALRTARDKYQTLAADFPAVPEYRQKLAHVHFKLGVRLFFGNPFAELSAKEHRLALVIREKLAADFPAVPEYRKELAISHRFLGILLQSQVKRAEAEEQYRQEVATWEKLAADFPAVPEYRVNLGESYSNFGDQVRDAGKPAESLAWFQKAIDTLGPVHEKEPRNVSAKGHLQSSHTGRAKAYDRLEKYADAVKDWNQAIELIGELEQPGLWASRAMSRLRAGEVAEAVAEVAELRKSADGNANQWYDFACFYAVASGKVATQKAEYAERAMALLQKAVKAGYKDATHMKKDTDLDPLRGRDDFKNMLAELEKEAEKK